MESKGKRISRGMKARKNKEETVWQEWKIWQNSVSW